MSDIYTCLNFSKIISHYNDGERNEYELGDTPRVAVGSFGEI
jgi:hypothetical protein